MTDAPEDRSSPEWLVALRDPVLGDLRLSPFIVAPEHIPNVLKAFGQQHPPAQRWIVIALDEMAIKLSFARRNKAPKKFSSADDHLEKLESAAANFLALWRETSPYYEALLRASVLMVPSQDRRSHKFNFSNIDAGTPMAKLMPVIGALRNRDIYARAYSQPLSSQKALERALLWEPLFHLLHEFKIDDFGEHQPLIETIRSLHRACGIKPPDPVAVRQTLSDWRKRER
ncbi:MAG TPA: hypothetical protein VE999_12320 [Gemmataceae bacterium]|jgi:hypothetical protein|nr:hypothetical protein [Gemmataceae bacterium]